MRLSSKWRARTDAAVLEVAGEDREPEQQPEQVREDHPLVRKVADQAPEPGALCEAGENELESRDGGKPGQRYRQSVVVQEGDPEQGDAEQDELHRDADLDRHLPEGRLCGEEQPRRERSGE